ncbi:FRG domain-containing protein [Pasteurella atlantica]|uniref:FRG domain-containing protein n=1 Tax=Pasteurellaceae TaxID=712 RepID=UPI00275AFC2F|nr:FRG domain-containing protein [Pasteurella atlantica]MDP8033179.1 FRG domain-containing protein [Pasteurella atlantica]MDP8035116.1 FRG domain-containing protein [Pasteurella atlantica]MDP8036924.1 FRG domain-containing protein [Pasteurella atlantica]MDP8047550.1 FRG domain-containing protein [Pasteurella atlantica]MDP8049219.1 FRG domain-containing protein [Pasteurella atlantica]
MNKKNKQFISDSNNEGKNKRVSEIINNEEKDKWVSEIINNEEKDRWLSEIINKEEKESLDAFENKEVSPVSKILNKIPKGKDGNRYTRFFRGVSNETFEQVPSIYRNKGLIENEEQILHDALLNSPQDFINDKSLFDKLVKLQHYGFPTRLLDITSNILVALYFAAQGSKNEDGNIIIFDIPNEHVKYSSDDKVRILSCLAINNCNFNIDEKSLLLNAITKLVNEDDQAKRELQSKLNSSENTSLSSEFVNKLNEIYINIKDSKEDQFNLQKDTLQLISDIKYDKNGCDIKVSYEDIEKVLCVKAKMNNPRIIRQQGAFLLFGSNLSEENRLSAVNVNPDWMMKIKIQGKDKKEILEELRSLGISKQALFPELETQAEDIKKKYEQLSADKKTKNE